MENAKLLGQEVGGHQMDSAWLLTSWVILSKCFTFLVRVIILTLQSFFCADEMR